MDEVKRALKELAHDPSISDFTESDYEEISRELDAALRRMPSDRTGATAMDRAGAPGVTRGGIDLGPKTVCLIKCAIQFGLCKAKKGKDCNTNFASCVADCYIK